jgi:hypothetical protein
MTEGLFDRYFALLAGRLPASEYGVLADADEDTAEAPSAPVVAVALHPECLC